MSWTDLSMPIAALALGTAGFIYARLNSRAFERRYKSGTSELEIETSWSALWLRLRRLIVGRGR